MIRYCDGILKWKTTSLKLMDLITLLAFQRLSRTYLLTFLSFSSTSKATLLPNFSLIELILSLLVVVMSVSFYFILSSF